MKLDPKLLGTSGALGPSAADQIADESSTLLDALQATLGEHANGMPVAAVIGVLEMLKHRVLEAFAYAVEDDGDDEDDKEGED